MNEVAELQRARALIARGWTQGASARTIDGLEVDSEDPSAVFWCPVGAVHVGPGRNSSPKIELLLWLGKLAGTGQTIALWNDVEGRTQAEVLALFDRAIEAKTTDARSSSLREPLTTEEKE